MAGAGAAMHLVNTGVGLAAPVVGGWLAQKLSKTTTQDAINTASRIHEWLQNRPLNGRPQYTNNYFQSGGTWRGMPYRRKRSYTRRRRGGSMPSWMRGKYRRVGSYKRFSSTMAPRREYKFLDDDVEITGAASDAPVFVTNLNKIAQGSEDQQRIGRAAHIHSMHIKGTLTQQAGTSTGPPDYTSFLIPNKCRFIIGLDTQCNGSAPGAWGDIFNKKEYDGSTLAAEIDYMKDLTEGGRYKILCDITTMLGSGVGENTNVNAGEKRMVDCYRRFKRPIKITYDNTTSAGSLASIRDNNIFCVLIGENPVAQSTVAFSGVCRLRFTD